MKFYVQNVAFWFKIRFDSKQCAILTQTSCRKWFPEVAQWKASSSSIVTRVVGGCHPGRSVPPP